MYVFTLHGSNAYIVYYTILHLYISMKVILFVSNCNMSMHDHLSYLKSGRQTELFMSFYGRTSDSQ